PHCPLIIFVLFIVLLCLIFFSSFLSVLFPFFFNAPPPTEIYTLSLHDALPISLLISLYCCMLGIQTSMSKVFAMPALTSAAASLDRKSTRLNSSHVKISYAVFCLKKKKIEIENEKEQRGKK